MRRYYPWRLRKRKVLALLFAYQLAILALGLLTLSWEFASVIVPLYLFSMAVLLFATSRYARDGDIEVIYTALGANLGAAASVMMRRDLSAEFGLGAHDRDSLRDMLNMPEALKVTGKLFAEHRIRSHEPSEAGRKAADIILLLLGALVGAVAQKHLAPPPLAALSGFSIGDFISYEGVTVIIVSIMLLSAAALAVTGRGRQKKEDDTLKKWAREDPAQLFGVFFAGDREVQLKIGSAIRAAAALTSLNSTVLDAMQQITGLDLSGRQRRPTALGDIQWLMFTFNMGIVFGAILPPLVGLG